MSRTAWANRAVRAASRCISRMSWGGAPLAGCVRGMRGGKGGDEAVLVTHVSAVPFFDVSGVDWRGRDEQDAQRRRFGGVGGHEGRRDEGAEVVRELREVDALLDGGGRVGGVIGAEEDELWEGGWHV